MKIYIKNMVCDRCILVIRNVLAEQGLVALSIDLGEVDFGPTELQPAQLQAIKTSIEPLGFELIDDKKSRLIEKIKNAIIDLIHRQQSSFAPNLSEFLSARLHYDYNYLSGLFSSVEGITIEQYLIQQKIEKVKELLVYDELSLTAIAYQLGYSSVAHLSRQFKKVTGLTPSHFKRLKDNKKRIPLDKV